VLQLGVTLFALLIWRLLEILAATLGRRWLASGERNAGEHWLRILGHSGVALAGLMALGGVLALILNSFAGFWRFPNNLPGAWTLGSWNRALAEIALPLSNTLVIAAVSTLLAITMVIAVLESEQLSGRRASPSLLLLYLPLLVPQIAFLFGIMVATEFARLAPGIELVIFAHLIFVLPYTFLSLSEAYRRLDPRWGQLAATLGISRWRSFWRVRLPLLLAPCLTAVAIGIAVSIGQYLATALIGAGRVPTLTTEAVALASGGSRGIVAVWALLQALLPMLGFALALFLPRLFWRKRRGMRGLS
jgi:putative thiamine transport system permease protein